MSKHAVMSELEQLEMRVKNLTPAELARFREWFIEFDHLVWDKQIKSDSESGKLDHLLKDALTDFKAGRARKI